MNNKTYKQRRQELEVKLKAAYTRFPNHFTNTCLAVGSIIGVSGVTVRNYMTGNAPDGYLGEDILAAWLKYNRK